MFLNWFFILNIFLYDLFIVEFGFGVFVVIVIVEGGEDVLKVVKVFVKYGILVVVVEGIKRVVDILVFVYYNCVFG